MPGDSGFTCGDYACVLCFISHARLRVRRAPGIPHAFCFEGEWFMHNSGTSRREIAKLCRNLRGCLKIESGMNLDRHCER
jgi:hypothetical protein